VKDRWRKRVRLLWRVQDASAAERIALRKAHHNTCPCWQCQNKMRARPVVPWRGGDDDEG
jgi:hypothetical protein